MTREEPRSSYNTFDLEEALERVDGDTEFFGELVETFFDSAAELVPQMRKALKEGDPETFRRAAHSLKGAVGNFGAKKAYDLCYQLETKGREGNLAGAGELLSQLEEMIQTLEEELRQAQEELVSEGA